MKTYGICCLLALIFVQSAGLRAAELEAELPGLSAGLTQKLIQNKRNKVAALDFTDLRGRQSELGRYLAEQLAVELVMTEGITVVDRANLSAIMDEHKLTAEGLVKPENAKKLGEFAGVDAILIGSVTVMDDACNVVVKAISTETSEVVAAGRMKFTPTADQKRMAGLSVAGGSDARGASGSTSESTAISLRELGDLRVTIRDMAFSHVTEEKGYEKIAVQLILTSLRLENRNLEKSLLVAAHGSVDAENNHPISRPAWGAVRSQLNDVNGGFFYLRADQSIMGLSVVTGFETRRAPGGDFWLTQKTPGAIVRYIRQAKYYDFSSDMEEGIYWSGDFTKIPPGGSVDVNLTFRRAVENKSVSGFPKSLQFSMELITGTVESDQTAPGSKDLNLHNLVFDQIRLPEAAGKAETP